MSAPADVRLTILRSPDGGLYFASEDGFAAFPIPETGAYDVHVPSSDVRRVESLDEARSLIGRLRESETSDR